MRRPIKAHLINRSNRMVNRSNRPVNRSNRPVYRSKPVTHAILNLDLNSNRLKKPVKPAGIPVRTGWTEFFEFKFEFDRYRPVFGQTGPVYRYRTPAVWPVRSVNETLVVCGSHVYMESGIKCKSPRRNLYKEKFLHFNTLVHCFDRIPSMILIYSCIFVFTFFC